MPRLRVYELARKLNMPTKELLQELEDLGLEVKNHMSFIDAETVSLLLEIFEAEEKSVAKVAKQVKPKKVVPDEEKE
ncbi:MAG: translation initiation factor IF-2 N-terminal domain-containing protein, partial [Thermotogaceae bacterium]|nr:translation initiation factor IF-2 N-terminal domain-containing protein [Thermotogaceae bacterium]